MRPGKIVNSKNLHHVLKISDECQPTRTPSTAVLADGQIARNHFLGQVVHSRDYSAKQMPKALVVDAKTLTLAAYRNVE